MTAIETLESVIRENATAIRRLEARIKELDRKLSIETSELDIECSVRDDAEARVMELESRITELVESEEKAWQTVAKLRVELEGEHKVVRIQSDAVARTNCELLLKIDALEEQMTIKSSVCQQLRSAMETHGLEVRIVK